MAKLDPLYALYATVALLFNISYLRTLHPLSGMERHTMELFPVFFLLGVWGSRSAWLNRLILYPFILLWLWMSGQFFLWGWMG